MITISNIKENNYAANCKLNINFLVVSKNLIFRGPSSHWKTPFWEWKIYFKNKEIFRDLKTINSKDEKILERKLGRWWYL